MDPIHPQETISRQYMSPDAPLLFLDQNPAFIEFFAGNLQFIYSLEKQKDYIGQEWAAYELIKPCFFQEKDPEEVITQRGWTRFCWHKSKRYIHLKKLEDQAVQFF